MASNCPWILGFGLAADGSTHQFMCETFALPDLAKIKIAAIGKRNHRA
jgi:hypothetical protein